MQRIEERLLPSASLSPLIMPNIRQAAASCTSPPTILILVCTVCCADNICSTHRSFSVGKNAPKIPERYSSLYSFSCRRDNLASLKNCVLFF